MTTLTAKNALFAPMFDDPVIDELFSEEAMLRHFTTFENALKGALGKQGMIDANHCADAMGRMESFLPDVSGMAKGIVADGLPVPAYVAQAKAHLGPQLAEVFHIGTTSQDLIDSAFACAFAGANDLLLDRLKGVIVRLDALRDVQGASGLMGRTRMQAALPITVEHRLRTWRDPIERVRDQLEKTRTDVEVLQFGGPVGDRAAFGDNHLEIEKVIAEALGLAPVGRAWHTDRQAFVTYGDVMSHITGALGKIGQDICLMAQQGIEEIKLKGGGKSSAMSHKQNPIAAELLVTLARFNAVQVSGLHQAMVHEQERSGAMWALEWMILPEMVRVTGRALLVADGFLSRIERIGSG